MSTGAPDPRDEALRAWALETLGSLEAERTGNQSAMTRERGGLRPRRLFSLVLANAWLRTEGGAWIKATADEKRGQGVLRLVPKTQPETPA